MKPRARLFAVLPGALLLLVTGPALASALFQPPPGTPTAVVDPAAPMVQANTPTTVVLEPGQPSDLTYTASAGETVIVTARSLEEPGTLDPTVEVLAENGTRLAFNDDHGTRRQDLHQFDAIIDALALPDAGPVTIRLFSFTGAAEGRVELTIQSSGAGAGGQVQPPGPAMQTAIGDVAALGTYSYEFQGLAGQVVTITVQRTGGDLDPKAVVYEPSGTIIAENDDHGTGDASLGSFDSQIADLTLPATGTYIVEISGFAQSSGQFTLMVAFEEGGGLVVAPTIIAPPGDQQVVTGSIPPGGEYSHFFTAESGDVYTLILRGTGGDIDPQMLIYDAEVNLIAANDDHGSNDRTLGVTDSQIENLIFPTAGEYEVYLYGIDETSGDFELTVERVATDAPVGSPEESVSLGTVEPAGVYTTPIDAQAGDYITLTARRLTGDLDPSITLLDAQGNELANNDDHGGLNSVGGFLDARINNYPITATGTYTIEIQGYQNSSGTFGLTVAVLR